MFHNLPIPLCRCTYSSLSLSCWSSSTLCLCRRVRSSVVCYLHYRDISRSLLRIPGYLFSAVRGKRHHRQVLLVELIPTRAATINGCCSYRINGLQPGSFGANRGRNNRKLTCRTQTTANVSKSKRYMTAESGGRPNSEVCTY